MALDFPDSPSDGDYFEGFAWDATAGVWRVRGSAGKALGLSGGTEVTTGGYNYFAFAADGSLTVTTAGVVEALLVGGGGSGGKNYGGGGGGGGGVKHYPSLYLPAGSHSVTVGAGGLAGIGANATSIGANGGDSKIGNEAISFGGGRGGGGNYGNDYPTAGHGSNGGGSIYNTLGPQQVNDWGLANAGGLGVYVQSGGGGGGAGAPGVNSPGGQVAGAGGSGTDTFSAWGLATSLGHNVGGTVWFAGGGSGGPFNSATSSQLPGPGGGGTCVAGVGQDATVNTGGGGAGSGNLSLSGNGGSGVVIVRVAV